MTDVHADVVQQMNASCHPARFLITIDTEGDNLWSRPREITTRNSRYLPRFQELCERYGLEPTWLVNHEMARCPVFQGFGRDMLLRQAGEVGMHLHAWNSPPVRPLTDDDFRCQPYLTEYPEAVMRDKISRLTDQLEDTFGCRMASHRAGRWAFNEIYAQILVDRGYHVDCSVTPCLSWASMPGAPDGSGGCDYTGAPSRPYRIDPTNICRPGDSPLWEVPMTICQAEHPPLRDAVRRGLRTVPVRLARRIADRLLPTVHWLRPDGRNLDSMLTIVDNAWTGGWPVAQMMLHSSELMPGGSPRFPNERSIERLYEHLEALFSAVAGRFGSATLCEFADECGLREQAILSTANSSDQISC